MKTFIIILGDIPNEKADRSFANYIAANKFEWWRYTPLTWIIATPVNFTVEDIIEPVKSSYTKDIFTTVLEIDVKASAGAFNSVDFTKDSKPLSWFDSIKKEDFTPLWKEDNKEHR